MLISSSCVRSIHCWRNNPSSGRKHSRLTAMASGRSRISLTRRKVQKSILDGIAVAGSDPGGRDELKAALARAKRDSTTEACSQATITERFQPRLAHILKTDMYSRCRAASSNWTCFLLASLASSMRGAEIFAQPTRPMRKIRSGGDGQREYAPCRVRTRDCLTRGWRWNLKMNSEELKAFPKPCSFNLCVILGGNGYQPELTNR